MTGAMTAAELLAVWERGRGQSGTARALLLLAAATPDAGPEALARLSVGRRDGLLLTLRERLFGSRMTGLAACPQCRQPLELTFEAAEIRAGARGEQPETLAVEAGGCEAQFRLPNSEDLAALAAVGGDGRPGEMLLSRCLLRVTRAGREEPVDAAHDLPPALIEAIAARMEEADPQANVQLDLTCESCGHRWLAAFDIVAYLWGEIDDWARRTLREVHLLASAYGWRESDILALGAERRQLYLEMIGRVA
ncbi:MAG TPA: phage baseplate protein [Blastocatellia bacterium]|nr:phage baseplate protein [Blastocatellia bacterium]